MTIEPSSLPAEIDVDTPNPARIYDYLLGGAHNFAADREAGRHLLPGIDVAARENRSFLRRAVRYMMGTGIDQFLDLGSGIPTVGNVHEIAQEANPAARVVYVDNESVAVMHSQHLLADNPNAAMVNADLRQPATVLQHPDVRRLIDFTRPVGILLVAVFHFIPDAEDPAAILADYLAAAAPGSYLGLSHWSMDSYTPEKREHATVAFDNYRQRTGVPLVARDHAELAALLAGVDLVEPGIVWMPDWQPDDDDPTDLQAVEGYAAVGRIRTR